MRTQPGDPSTGDLILETWDSYYIPKLETLGYFTPLSKVLCAGISTSGLYDESLLYSLFTNQNYTTYTTDQLEQFLTDITNFSDGWAVNKPQGVKYLEVLRENILGPDQLSGTIFSLYWLRDGVNQHLLGILLSRVKSWIKLKNTPNHDLLTAIT